MIFSTIVKYINTGPTTGAKRSVNTRPDTFYFLRSTSNDLFHTRAFRTYAFTLFSMTVLIILAGCGPEHYRRKADKEAYDLIKQKQSSVREMPDDFSAEQPQRDILKGVPRKPEARSAEEKEPYLNKSTNNKPPKQIDLTLAMKLAAANSREFQTQREDVFLAALALSLQRDRFKPRFFGTATGNLIHQADDEQKISSDSSLGFSSLLKTGGKFTLDFSTVLSEYLTGDPREAASSLLNLTFTQPLLRGRGIAATEPLTQAERDLVYAMRRFIRFRRTFFTQVYSQYFGVLQQRQVLRNERLNLENLRRSRKRAEAMFEAGRLPGFQVDQTRQDEIRAEDRLERAQQSYHRTLDQFKTTLGVNPSTNLVLNMKDLEKMEDAERPKLPWPRNKAVEIGLTNRLDLQTARQEVEDARRKVKVALNDLKPGLDLKLSSDTATSGAAQPVNFSTSNNEYEAALDLDLPLERTAERNSYRRSLISLEAQKRQAEKTRDQVINDVRQAWRSYFRAWESYRIQRNSVKLARERVDSTTMLLNAGRASTRDMLEARESLIQAQNGLSRALVEYKVSRLELSRDIGTLTLADNYSLKVNFKPDLHNADKGNNDHAGR